MTDATLNTANAEKACGFEPHLWNADSGVIFSAPWQAQAFAMTVALNEAGLFSWNDWVDVFAAHRKASAENGRPDDGDTYYDDWLNALEDITAKRSLASSEVQRLYKHAWEHATRRTGHGKPILLQDVDFEQAKTRHAV